MNRKRRGQQRTPMGRRASRVGSRNRDVEIGSDATNGTAAMLTPLHPRIAKA